MTAIPERTRPRYRPARRLPYELREHCVIYFEEELYTQSLNLLINLLTSGTSSTTASGDPVPAFVPTPQQLSLAATLIVHPRLTTRATSKDRLQASNAAFRLLRNVNKIVGPINANFATAFSFSAQKIRNRGDGRRRGNEADSGDDPDTINTEIAGVGSLWDRAEDFWHAIGWAFNCSVVYQKRWERWKLWLEIMLDVLEDDWAERLRMAEEDDGRSSNEPGEDLLAQSMIAQYLSGRKGSYGNKRRFIRAIFADGSPKALAEFKEVFKNELRERKKDDETGFKRPVKVDIEKDVFGDYLDDTDDEAEENTAPTSTKQNEEFSSEMDYEMGGGKEIREDTNVPNGATHLGGMDSLILRQRFLSLVRAACNPTYPISSSNLHAKLSAVSAASAEYFTTLDDLYNIYIEHIKPLPLPTFSLFILPVLPNVDLAYRLSFNQLLLQILITTSAPPVNNDDLNQGKLETCYLPFPANTHSIADNAKVSLLIESLIRLLGVHAGLVYSEALETAIKTGVRARETKAKANARKKRDELIQEEEENLIYLRASSRRLKNLAEFLKLRG